MKSSKSSKNNARNDKGIKNKKVFTSIPIDEAWKFVENSWWEGRASQLPSIESHSSHQPEKLSSHPSS